MPAGTAAAATVSMRVVTTDPHPAPSLGLTPLSRVRLDELLQELLDRVGDVVASRERLRSLLDAVVASAPTSTCAAPWSGSSPPPASLVGARYGALGVIGEDRRLVEFITHGIAPDVHAAIGDLPTGRGCSGCSSTIRDRCECRTSPATRSRTGFRPTTRRCTASSGVPVRARETIYGNLYLAEKQGASEFTDDDEQIVVALAAAAGVAIDNARLYDAGAAPARWLAAAAEITEVSARAGAPHGGAGAGRPPGPRGGRRRPRPGPAARRGDRPAHRRGCRARARDVGAGLVAQARCGGDPVRRRGTSAVTSWSSTSTRPRPGRRRFPLGAPRWCRW